MFGGGDAGVGAEAVEVVEAVAGRPWRQGCFALTGEVFLEAVEIFPGEWVAGRDGAAGAGVAALEVDFADAEADDAALVGTEELIFPEGRESFTVGGGGIRVNLECGAETPASFVKRDSAEPLFYEGKAFGSGRGPFARTRGKPIRYSLQRRGGNDGGAVGECVIRESAFGIADDDLLLEEDTEPLRGVFVGFGKGEGARGNFAAIAGDGEGDAAKVGSVAGADEMDSGGALAVDPFAIHGMKGPGAIEGESAGRGDAGFGDVDRVEGFDGMKADVHKARKERNRGHARSLALSQRGKERGLSGRAKTNLELENSAAKGCGVGVKLAREMKEGAQCVTLHIVRCAPLHRVHSGEKLSGAAKAMKTATRPERLC